MIKFCLGVLDYIASDVTMILLFGISVILLLITFAILFSNNLFNNILLLSLFSLFISLLYLLMDAPDVAMTEAALGVFLSGAVFLNLLRVCYGKDLFTNNNIKLKKENIFDFSVKTIIAVVTILIFCFILFYVMLHVPEFGANDNPIHSGSSLYYLQNTEKEIAIDSFVAAILASYRGFDTLGETCVILIACLSGILVLSYRKYSFKKLSNK